ncbi:MAG: TlpA family protein disulfide reductase [Anaerolineae bacterium]|nr:TlpA family protein disulfide reductase [Anaerolineae bacterium]
MSDVQELQEQQAARRGLSPLVIVILLLVVGLLGVLGLRLIDSNRTQPNRGPAPDFTLELFEEMGGGEFTLSEHRGKVIVINFWASWCGPCRVEAPALQQVWEAYRDRGDVMLVGVDYVDNTQDALGYINEFGITYPNGPDLGTRISDAYRIQGVPETFVVGKDGNVFQFIYAGVSARDLANIIDRALAE